MNNTGPCIAPISMMYPTPQLFSTNRWCLHCNFQVILMLRIWTATLLTWTCAMELQASSMSKIPRTLVLQHRHGPASPRFVQQKPEEVRITSLGSVEFQGGLKNGLLMWQVCGVGFKFISALSAVTLLSCLREISMVLISL